MISGKISSIFPASMNPLLNHLWQCTIFALVVALLTLAFRKNRAEVRYWMWLTASLKFLFPFAVLIDFGGIVRHSLAAGSTAVEVATPAISQVLLQAAQPMPGTGAFAQTAVHEINWLSISFVAVWASGFLAVILMRIRGWLRVRADVRASKRMNIEAPVDVRSAPGLLEPGVVGFFRPILLLPEGILQSLTSPQLEAVLAHELAHIRRRDNLTAALHMLVEAIFWFHPIVWWIGAQLLAERERACDEAVLSLGNQPRVYAEAILSVCKLYTESPLTCISGVTGNSLNTRVRAILSQRLAGDMPMIKKTALALFGMAALILPVLIGMIAAHPAHAQLQAAANPSLPPAQPPSRPVAAMAGGRSHGSLSTLPYLPALGSVNAVSATVTAQVDGQLTSLNFTEGELVKQGQLLASIDVPTLRLQVERAQAHLDSDKKRLDDTRKSPTSPEQRDSLDQLQISIQTDQAELQDAQSRLQAGQVVAPITGVAGFHLIDSGNFVHTGDRLAVINQLQPISATFDVEEDYVSEVVGALKNGSSPKVELWNRDDSTRIATGHLAAIDNQIDPTTGMVKLRALFENKDGALFPNEFVNVHLFLNTR